MNHSLKIKFYLEIARKGRNALKVRNDRNTFKFSFSSINKENTETLNVE